MTEKVKKYLDNEVVLAMQKLDRFKNLENPKPSHDAVKESYAERCRDCICLVAGRNGEWICDEAERPCSEVEHCPEGVK